MPLMWGDMNVDPELPLTQGLCLKDVRFFFLYLEHVCTSFEVLKNLTAFFKDDVLAY